MGWTRGLCNGLNKGLCNGLNNSLYIIRTYNPDIDLWSNTPTFIDIEKWVGHWVIGLFCNSCQLQKKNCHWVVSIHLLRDQLVRFHYATTTLTSLGGFDPPPPTLIGTHPLRFNDSFDMCPFAKCFSIAHIRHSLHCVTYHRVVSINRPSGYEPDAV